MKKPLKFGHRTLKYTKSKLMQGKDVEELQLRLAGFAGTDWDGKFGKNTKKQVELFQKEYMKMQKPTGIVEATGKKKTDTFKALDRFAKEFPIDFGGKLLCQFKVPSSKIKVCTCGGFGQQRFKKIYKSGRTLLWNRESKKVESHVERIHQYEYPGIHKAILHSYRALLFFVASNPRFKSPRINSGYRCHINNAKPTKRNSTNHMGKALDIGFGGPSAEQWKICNEARDLLVNKSNFQIRWTTRNKKSLEPGVKNARLHKHKGDSFAASTWVHMDVRNFEAKYLEDRFFVKSLEELDNKILG